MILPLGVHPVVQAAVSGLELQAHAFVDSVLSPGTYRIEECQRTLDLFEDSDGIYPHQQWRTFHLRHDR
jgi:hypothetical protein